MKSRVLSLLAIVAVLCCAVGEAQIPRTLNYQGYLTTPSGAPINAPQSLVVGIYDAASGGNLLFTETHSPVTVSNGIFNILLGSVDVTTNPWVNDGFTCAGISSVLVADTSVSRS